MKLDRIYIYIYIYLFIYDTDIRVVIFMFTSSTSIRITIAAKLYCTYFVSPNKIIPQILFFYKKQQYMYIHIYDIVYMCVCVSVQEKYILKEVKNILNKNQSSQDLSIIIRFTLYCFITRRIFIIIINCRLHHLQIIYENMLCYHHFFQ